MSIEATLPPTFRASFSLVHQRNGANPEQIEKILAMLANAAAPDAVVALLEAERPRRAAWMAATDGYLHSDQSGYLLCADAHINGEFHLNDGVSHGGGAPCYQNGQRFLSAYRYGPLGDRTLRKPPGSSYAAGELLTDGELDPHDLLGIMGARASREWLGSQLARLCRIDEVSAAPLVAPLFDVCEIADPRGGSLRQGMRVHHRRFEQEIGHVLGQSLANLTPNADPRLREIAAMSDEDRFRAYAEVEDIYVLLEAANVRFDPPYASPLLVGYSTLARLDEEGRLAREGKRFDLGSFEVTCATLRATDPCYLDKPLGKNDLPAQPGTWRAASIVTDRPSWGPQVEELRVWFADQAVNFDEPFESTGWVVGVDSGMAGFFDTREAASEAAGREDFAEACYRKAKEAGAALASLIEDFGVVSFSGAGDGGYSCRVKTDANGMVVAARLEFGP